MTDTALKRVQTAANLEKVQQTWGKTLLADLVTAAREGHEVEVTTTAGRVTKGRVDDVNEQGLVLNGVSTTVEHVRESGVVSVIVDRRQEAATSGDRAIRPEAFSSSRRTT